MFRVLIMAGSVVCDLDGVLYLDNHPIPGAAEALAELEAAGYRLLFVTNNATTHLSELIEKLERAIGFRPSPDAVVSSAMAGASMVAGRESVAFVVGEHGLARTLEDAGVTVTDDWRKAEAVVVGLDRSLTFETIKDATLAIRAGARFVATNLDSTYPTPEGLWPGGGAIAAALEAASGVEPEVAGKPHEPMRALVRRRLGAGPVWMVGDRPETDLAMGKLEGWSTALVLTGVVDSVEEVPAEFTPDLVLDSIADLPGTIS